MPNTDEHEQYHKKTQATYFHLKQYTNKIYTNIQNFNNSNIYLIIVYTFINSIQTIQYFQMIQNIEFELFLTKNELFKTAATVFHILLWHIKYQMHELHSFYTPLFLQLNISNTMLILHTNIINYDYFTYS